MVVSEDISKSFARYSPFMDRFPFTLLRRGIEYLVATFNEEIFIFPASSKSGIENSTKALPDVCENAPMFFVL